MSITLGWLAFRDYMRDHGEPVLMAIGQEGYFDLVWYEYLGLVTLACLAVAWTIHSVEWQRHGDLVLPDMLRWRAGEAVLPTREPHLVVEAAGMGSSGSRGIRAARKRSFHNAVVAQAWCELRRSAPLWWVVGGANLLLAFMGATNVLYTQLLFLARFPKLCISAALILLSHIGVFAWDASHDWPLLLLWKTYGFVVPLAILSVSLLAIVFAIRAGYLSGWYFASVFSIWLMYAASAVYLVSTSAPPVPIPLWAYLFGVALLLVPLASAAFAPLALASHRHA